jgi:hypothetical protein
MVICGSRRRSLEKPGSRNPSPWSASKYRVDTSYETSDAGPSRACAAQASDSRCRHGSCAQTGRRRLSVGYDGAGAPASSRTRSESCLLAGSMIRASTSCPNTSSCPVACGNPSASYARHRASHRCPIREEAISSGPDGPGPSRPRSSSACPAASRCRAAALSASSSASSCAEPMCSMFRDPRRKDHTIWTAVAPEEVFTVRTYATRRDYEQQPG